MVPRNNSYIQFHTGKHSAINEVNYWANWKGKNGKETKPLGEFYQSQPWGPRWRRTPGGVTGGAAAGEEADVPGQGAGRGAGRTAVPVPRPPRKGRVCFLALTWGAPSPVDRRRRAEISTSSLFSFTYRISAVGIFS